MGTHLKVIEACADMKGRMSDKERVARNKALQELKADLIQKYFRRLQRANIKCSFTHFESPNKLGECGGHLYKDGDSHKWVTEIRISEEFQDCFEDQAELAYLKEILIHEISHLSPKNRNHKSPWRNEMARVRMLAKGEKSKLLYRLLESDIHKYTPFFRLEDSKDYHARENRLRSELNRIERQISARSKFWRGPQP